MRKGDIVVNPWVSVYFRGELNPNYATIYLGDNESLDYTGEVCKWADKIYKDNPKRRTPWKVIGHVDLYGIAERAIKDAVSAEQIVDAPHTDFWSSVTREDWLKAHGLATDTPQTERAIDLTGGESNMKNDLISRQAAIDATWKEPTYSDPINILTEIRDRLEAIPSVADLPSADRPQGEWIETSEGTMCSNCHKYPYDDGEYHIANWHSDYCPNCGSRNRKGNE